MMNQLLMSVLAQRKSKPETNENYVRFVSAEARTITPKYTNDGVTLQYSVDSGATWTNISSGASTTSATEHWFRGQATGTKSLFISDSSYANEWSFSGSSDLEVYGNLNFLLCNTLGDEVAPTSLGNYCYAYMFSGCTSLTTAPELPATTLANRCYDDMFFGCTSLTTSPELPATTLGNYCYSNMFRGCTSLTTAPELPATTLANYCYRGMFYGCTSLTTAPELPATTLASYCYRYMFYGCTSLTTTPALPATTLANSCYQSMFQNCTSLTVAPELPATTLGDSCYKYMFSGCTSFKVSATQTGSYTYSWRIPTSGTGVEGTGWNTSMLSGTGGTFTSDPTINRTYYVENQPVLSEHYVRFYDFQGTGNTLLKTQTVISGGNATPPADPVRTGYTWLGWDKSYTNVQSNLDVYGTWQINTYTVRFYDYQGGTLLSTQTVNHGASATAPTQPTRTGYEFTGWSPPYTNITTNTDIYGQWAEEANGFNLTINYDRLGDSDIFYYKINEDTTYSQIMGDTSITIPNVTQVTFYYTSYGPSSSSYHHITGSYTISGGYYILNEPMIINFYTSTCFIEGTQISLGNGLTKNVEDITYDDELLVWNFDEGKFDTAKPICIKEKEVATKYLESTYSDGTILKTTGRMPSAHRIFNKELGRFTSLGKDETPIGTTTFNSLGEEVTLTNIKYINDTVNYYNIITDKHINLFANTILTSCRLSNLYTIKDMKYIKDDRELNENFGIPEDLFLGLRIAEQPINLNAENFDTTIEQYIKHMMYRQKEKK